MEKNEGVVERGVNGLPITQTERIRLRNMELKPLFRELVPELWEWINSVSKFGNNPIDAMVLDVQDGVYQVTMFSLNYKYTITAHNNYLGATMSFRTPRAGEDWTRGQDLADGDYSADTWHRILADILAVELVRLGK